MDRKLIAALLLILASCGCRACDCSCDYLPPVLDGPYASPGLRAGTSMANPITPAPIPEEAIAPLPISE